MLIPGDSAIRSKTDILAILEEKLRGAKFICEDLVKVGNELPADPTHTEEEIQDYADYWYSRGIIDLAELVLPELRLERAKREKIVMMFNTLNGGSLTFSLPVTDLEASME